MSNHERADRGERSTPPPDGAGSGTTVRDAPGREPRRGRVRITLDLLRANPTGRVVLKITVAVLGALVVAVGLALIPLPGPGWLIVIAGLAIWAVEFIWARRLLEFTRRNVRGWTKWVGRQSIPVRALLGTVGLAFVAAVVWASLKYSFGIDVVQRALAYLATH
ncbi:TIGR02611 family protein [Micromonospora zhanjiangensis]|uniref:TIGR02611 family protein n=1 Tax=Micromonospora zhanjiangensis TaxID=1522057 RepID=A0ABV8KWX4_9ACTN